jgi:hypothetical protein
MREFIKKQYNNSYKEFKTVPARLLSFLNKNPEIKKYCLKFLD